MLHLHDKSKSEIQKRNGIHFDKIILIIRRIDEFGFYHENRIAFELLLVLVSKKRKKQKQSLVTMTFCFVYCLFWHAFTAFFLRYSLSISSLHTEMYINTCSFTYWIPLLLNSWRIHHTFEWILSPSWQIKWNGSLISQFFHFIKMQATAVTA